MVKSIFLGAISTYEEFLYPDSKLSILPQKISLVMPKNGNPGVQILLKTEESKINVDFASQMFDAECFSMQAIPVEYNTGDGKEQGGPMVLEKALDQKPEYATKLAPFEVYDCLKPSLDGNIEVQNELAAIYLCLKPKSNVIAGEHCATVHIGNYTCTINIHVYDVEIPKDTFGLTNWFSLDAICRFHNVEKNTTPFYEMVRKYAKLMHRMHQTIFYLELDDTCVAMRDPYQFDFEYLRPLIECFFSEGMQYMELGTLLSRGYLPDGMPDMYTDTFKCSMAPEIPIDTPQGYTITVTFVKQLADFLKKYHWQDKVMFHIHDEPDIHFKDESTLLARKRQYYLAANILRKYLPNVRIIEAVSTAEFRGGVDIWVPGTPGYEENKETFDELIKLGEEVWTYVCCGPEGEWLNRFLDFGLLKGRLLFWGCAANRLGGFLHWGLNQFPEDMDPFKSTSCPNHTGIGTNFPCGDSFIVYPGIDGPWPGMRLEAVRKGAEDAALLQLLRSIAPEQHDELISKVFTDNHTYCDDTLCFAQVYEQLLEILQKLLQRENKE